MDDNFIDAGSRVCELEGLSGAPVWDDNADANGLLGVFTSAYGATALLSKTYVATVYKGNIIKNLIMDCQSYTKYRPNETTGGIFVSWRRKEELPTGA